MVVIDDPYDDLRSGYIYILYACIKSSYIIYLYHDDHPGPEQCYSAKTVVEAHNACAGDPYFPFVLDATETWHMFFEPDDEIYDLVDAG